MLRLFRNFVFNGSVCMLSAFAVCASAGFARTTQPGQKALITVAYSNADHQQVALGPVPPPDPWEVAIGPVPPPDPWEVAIGPVPPPDPWELAIGPVPPPDPWELAIGPVPPPDPWELA